jgi:spore coat protein U-like protein
MRFPRKATICLLATGVLLVRPHQPVQAASATANLTVGATIVTNCTISTTPVAFSSYDPVGTHATNNDDSGTGTVTVTCTKGTSATVGLALGQNASGSTRRMLNGTSNYLKYELYQDVQRRNVWGTDGSAAVSVGAAPTKAPRTFTVYGRVFAGQDLPAGSYSDTVQATVNF